MTNTRRSFLSSWMLGASLLLQVSCPSLATEQRSAVASVMLSERAAAIQAADDEQKLPLELKALYLKGKEALTSLNPQQRTQLLAAMSKLVEDLQRNEAAASHSRDNSSQCGDPVGMVLQMPLEREIPTPPAATTVSRWKQKFVAAAIGTMAAFSTLSGVVATDHWKKAIALAIAASMLYSSTSVIGVLVPIPEQWQGLSRTFARAVIGACLTIPANMLYYSVVELGLAPGSTVNIIAIGALMSIVGGGLGTFNNLIFFHQPQVWTVWVGLVSATAVAILQMWYALTYPVAMAKA